MGLVLYILKDFLFDSSFLRTKTDKNHQGLNDKNFFQKTKIERGVYVMGLKVYLASTCFKNNVTKVGKTS